MRGCSLQEVIARTTRGRFFEIWYMNWCRGPGTRKVILIFCIQGLSKNYSCIYLRQTLQGINLESPRSNDFNGWLLNLYAWHLYIHCLSNELKLYYFIKDVLWWRRDSDFFVPYGYMQLKNKANHNILWRRLGFYSDSVLLAIWLDRSRETHMRGIAMHK